MTKRELWAIYCKKTGLVDWTEDHEKGPFTAAHPDWKWIDGKGWHLSLEGEMATDNAQTQKNL